MIQQNEKYLLNPFSKNGILGSGKSVFDIAMGSNSSTKTQNTPKTTAVQTSAAPKNTYSVEERDARVRNAYASRPAEDKRKAETIVPKKEDDFLKGFFGDRGEENKVSSVWTKPVHAWEKQNIFASREQTPKFTNTQWRSSYKSPYYGDTPEFVNYSATRPTGDIKTDEDLEIFLEGFSDPYGEKKKEEKSKYQKTLDGISTALTAASFIPGLDTFTNIAQIPVDLLRGDFLGAGLDLVGAIPFVGEVADIGKTARTADRIIDTAKAAEKIDDAVDIAKSTDKATNAYKTATVAENAKDTARTVTSASEKLDVSSFPMKIHSGRYGKHIVGHNNFIPGNSIVEIPEKDCLQLLKKFSGTGQKINASAERIDFGKTIGKYVDLETGKAYDTTVATVRYSKDGIHIVPAKPNNWKGN